MTTPAPTFTQSTWLIAKREITMRLRSRAFLISTGILLFAVLASIVIGSVVSSNASKSVSTVAAVGSASRVLEGAKGFDVKRVSSVAAAERLVRSGAVEAAVVPDSSALGVSVIAKESAPGALVGQLSWAPTVKLLEPPTQNPLLLYLVSIGFGIAFFMSAITFGNTIALSVVEEKQTRVVEILLATVSVRALMAGKILGNSLLAFAQIAIVAAIAGIGLLISGQSALLGQLGPSLVWFVIFFTFGFVLLASLFAAAASMVSRQEDMAAVTSPVTMLVMIPYLLVFIFSSNPLVVGIMSYVPFAAPIGMPIRVFVGSAQWWEPILSLVILLLSTAAVIAFGSRIYGNSLLRMGGRVKLRDALAG